MIKSFVIISLLSLIVSNVSGGNVDQLLFKPCGTNGQNQDTASATLMPNYENPYSSLLTYRFSQGAANSLSYADSVRIVTTVPDTNQAVIDRTIQICGPSAQSRQKCSRQIIESRSLTGSTSIAIPYDNKATNTKMYVLDSSTKRNILELCVVQE